MIDIEEHVVVKGLRVEVKSLREAHNAEKDRTEIVRVQAYQVIGLLLNKCGLFESGEGQRALDYFAGDEVDEDFLPWPRHAAVLENKK